MIIVIVMGSNAERLRSGQSPCGSHTAPLDHKALLVLLLQRGPLLPGIVPAPFSERQPPEKLYYSVIRQTLPPQSNSLRIFLEGCNGNGISYLPGRYILRELWQFCDGKGWLGHKK
jgi:hypothetical protein